MVCRYVLLLPAFLAASALHRCGLTPSRFGTEVSLQAFFNAIEEVARQLRLQAAADFKPVLCNFLERYVREKRRPPRIEHIHGSELLRAVELPELRAACKEWLIGQRIMILADAMCDKVIEELHRCRDAHDFSVSDLNSNSRKRTDITETPEKGQPDDEPDDSSRRLQHS